MIQPASPSTRSCHQRARAVRLKTFAPSWSEVHARKRLQGAATQPAGSGTFIGPCVFPSEIFGNPLCGSARNQTLYAVVPPAHLQEGDGYASAQIEIRGQVTDRFVGNARTDGEAL